jgi:hypothetical protein
MGYLFMKSAATKWRNPLNFILLLSRFTWPLPFLGVRQLAYGVMLTETLLAAAFSFNLGNGYRQPLAGIVLISFTVFLLRNRASFQTGGCACFGDNSNLNRFPIMRNLILITLLLNPITLGVSLSPLQSTLQGSLLAVAAAAGFAMNRLRRPFNPSKQPLPAEAFEHPILYVSYRLNGFKEADRLLSEPSSRVLFVVLEAPIWIFNVKQLRWSSHRVVASDGSFPGREAFLLHRDQRGNIKHFSEWYAYLQMYIGVSEKSQVQ